MRLKAFHITWTGGDPYSALAYAETANKARAMAVGYYTGNKEHEPYHSIRARRVPHMDNHPDAPQKPCIIDGATDTEKAMINDSRIFRCDKCGVDFRERESCDCEEDWY